MSELESTAIIVRPQVLPSTSQFAMMRELAERLAYADGFLPKHFFQGDPQTRKHRILAAIEYGRAVGIEPMIALQNITMIDGKAGASALLIGALLRRASYDVSAEYTANDQACTVTISKAGKVTGRGHFSLEAARRAGLVRDGSGWTKYPRDMLYARALTQAARQGAQDAVLGMAFTSEELGVEVDEDGQATGEIPLAQASPETVAALTTETIRASQALAVNAVGALTPSVEASPAVSAGAGMKNETTTPPPPQTRSDSTPPPTPTTTAEAPATPPPTSAPSTTFHRLGRSVGPTAKRTNVIQAPTVTATPVETATQSPVSTEVVSGQPAPSAPADEAERIPFDDEVDEGQQVYLRQLRSDLREQAATLAHLNAIARNHKAALEGKPQEVVPPATPSTESDALLEARIGHDWSGQTLATLDEEAITALSERFEPMILKRREQLKEKGIAE